MYQQSLILTWMCQLQAVQHITQLHSMDFPTLARHFSVMRL